MEPDKWRGAVCACLATRTNFSSQVEDEMLASEVQPGQTRNDSCSTELTFERNIVYWCLTESFARYFFSQKYLPGTFRLHTAAPRGLLKNCFF